VLLSEKKSSIRKKRKVPFGEKRRGLKVLLDESRTSEQECNAGEGKILPGLGLLRVNGKKKKKKEGGGKELAT